MEEAMEGPRGHLITRAFRLQNLMDAKVHIGLAQISVEEAHVLELISMERPRGLMDGD